MTRKVEIQRQHPPLKCATESALPALVPLPVDDLERHVLVRRSGAEPQYAEVVRVGLLEAVLRRGRPVDEIGVEDVELVPLHDLGGGVVVVVVGLVVRVPIVPGLDAIEVPRLAGAVLVLPRVGEPPAGGVEVELVVEAELLLEVTEVRLHPPGEGPGGRRGGVAPGRRLPPAPPVDVSPPPDRAFFRSSSRLASNFSSCRTSIFECISDSSILARCTPS